MGEYSEMLLTEVDYESRLNSSGLGYGTIQGSYKHEMNLQVPKNLSIS